MKVSKVVIDGDGNQTMVEEDFVELSMDEVVAIAEANAPPIEIRYAVNRVKEYPSIGDQLDALFHAGVFPQEMHNRIAAVKAKYPKPSE